MVCVACLLPLFLIPIINLLPRILDLIMKKVYGLFGWEYTPPVRVPPSCPIKSSKIQTNTSNVKITSEEDTSSAKISSEAETSSSKISPSDYKPNKSD